MTRLNKNAFSKMELKSLQLEFNIYENTEVQRDIMKLIFLLDRISLDDTRQFETKRRPIKLIEKYVLKKASPKPMINVTFESKMVKENEEATETVDSRFLPEKKISTIISNLRLCVNVDYLLLLHDFFVDGLPKKTTPQSLDSSLLEEASPTSKFKKSPNKEDDQVNQRIFCELKFENPQFILYENQHELKRTNSLIIDGVIFLNLSTVDYKTKVYAALTDFMIRLKAAKTKRFQKQIKYLILSPTMISFTGIIDDTETEPAPEKVKTSFILDLQEINFNLCPLMLNTSLIMATSIQNSLNQRFKDDIVEEEDRIKQG